MFLYSVTQGQYHVEYRSFNQRWWLVCYLVLTQFQGFWPSLQRPPLQFRSLSTTFPKPFMINDIIYRRVYRLSNNVHSIKNNIWIFMLSSYPLFDFFIKYTWKNGLLFISLLYTLRHIRKRTCNNLWIFKLFHNIILVLLVLPVKQAIHNNVIFNHNNNTFITRNYNQPISHIIYNITFSFKIKKLPFWTADSGWIIFIHYFTKYNSKDFS